MLKLRIKELMRLEFLRREDGTVALETVIVLPLLFWTYLSMFSIFDAFRQYSINQKAAFTIGDMISRETVPIDNEYLDGAQDLFDYMTRSNAGGSAIRITSIRWDDNKVRYRRDWSKSRGWVPENRNQDVQEWVDSLPIMPHNERVIVVETWSKYSPPFNTGLEVPEIRNFVFTRPRYADKVLWVEDLDDEGGD